MSTETMPPTRQTVPEESDKVEQFNDRVIGAG